MAYLTKTYDFQRPADPDLAAWFEPERVKVNEDDARAALALVIAWARKHFDKRINMQRTPTGFGRELLVHALPEDVRYENIPDGHNTTIRDHLSTPHRIEVFQPKKGKAYEHDARVAYLAHCRAVPVYLRERCLVDYKNELAGYRQGFYRATVTVPERWNKIGLVPAEKIMLGDQATYRYPRTPGETFTYWFHESEMKLMEDFKWPFRIHQRILFAQGEVGLTGLDPLRLWRERFNTAIIEAEQRASTDRIWALFRYAVRVAALHTIGAFNPSHAAAGLKRTEEGWVEDEHLAASGWNARWDHPEWFAAITARTRVVTTRKALDVPLAQLVSINGDAVFTTAPIPGMADTGKVGAYRLKGVR